MVVSFATNGIIINSAKQKSLKTQEVFSLLGIKKSLGINAKKNAYINPNVYF